MSAHDTWVALHRIATMSPMELYEDDESDRIFRICRRQVEKMSASEMRVTLSAFVRDVMLSPEAIERGEGWEEVLDFLDWVDGGME